MPFFLRECKAYLIEHGFDWDDYQILQCYMLFGWCVDKIILIERKSLFMEITGVTRGTVITFVTPRGVSKGTHSSLIHSEISAKGLFAEVEE